MNAVKRGLLASLLVACSLPVFSQSEKEIVSNYRKALQLATVDSAVKTMEFSGTFTMAKMVLPIKAYMKSPKSMRLEMSIQSALFVQVTNDSLRWEYNPFEDKHKVTRIDGQNDAEAKKSDFGEYVQKHVLGYPGNKSTLKLLRKTKLDSLEVAVLEFARSDDKKNKTKLYFNTKNWLLYKIEDSAGQRWFANYHTANGYVFPRYYRVLSPDQDLEGSFNRLTFNTPVADSLFTIPAAAMAAMNAPSKSAAHVAADRCYAEGKYDSAEWLYGKVIKADNDNAQALNSRGLARIANEKYYDAIADFSRVLELEPRDPVAWNNRGLAKYYLDDRKGSLADYTKSLEIKVEANTLRNRASLYMHMGEYENAVRDLEKSISIEPQDAAAYFNYGVSLAELEKYELALKAYDSAAKFGNDDAALINYRGVSRYQLEAYGQAKDDFAKAMSMEPEHLQYLQNYGNTLYRLGEYKEALVHFERYVKREKDDAEVHNMMGLCKYQEENYKGAIADFTRAIELSEHKNAVYYDNRAASKEMLEDYEGSIKDYTESIRIYPNDASAFYKRGLIKIHTSRKMEGCLDLATANEMSYEPAKEAILKNCH